MNAVIVDKLSKSFEKDKKALDDVSFTLKQGEIFGFLGPNGAGKTTTIKLLNGMLSPSRGTCRVFDLDPWENAKMVHQLSGVLTEHAQMYDNLTGLQNLMFYATLFGLETKESSKRAKILLEKLGLLDAKDQKLMTYSTGMRQRLSLARAMIHRPKILFLDEPTSGLDPESVQSVNQLIKDLAMKEGTTIFLCTHQLRYAQEICTSYGLLDKGVLLAKGNIEKLRKMVAKEITVRIKTDVLPSQIQFQKKDNQFYEMGLQSEEEIPYLIKQIVEHGGNIYHVSAHQPSLEEIYFSLLEEYEKRRE